MIEVEIKIPLTIIEFKHIWDTITKLGGEHLGSELQQDTYYDHPCRSFQETDEAVRIRQRIPLTHDEVETIHPLSEVDYKGPKIDMKSKTRLELSIGITDTTIANTMLKELGFQPVATITKERSFFKYGIATICIDDVKDVGYFMELERLVPTEEELEPVREQLFVLVKNLGLEEIKMVRKSYLELYLEKKNQ